MNVQSDIKDNLKKLCLSGDVKTIESTDLDQCKSGFVLMYAAEIGSMDIVKVMFRKYKQFHCNDLSNAIGYACDNNHFDIAKFIKESGPVPNSEAVNLLADTNSLDGFKWIVDQFDFKDMRHNRNFIFRAHCSKGNVDIVKWIATKFEFNADDVRILWCSAFRSACNGGYNELAQWLVTEFNLTVNDVESTFNYLMAIINKDSNMREIIKWLHERFSSLKFEPEPEPVQNPDVMTLTSGSYSDSDSGS